jgi:lysophospholipase L1-like esterase
LIKNPNYEYLLKYARPLSYLFDPKYLLHDDGWLEMAPPKKNVNIESISDQATKELTSRNLHFSRYRFLQFQKTITYLKQYGTVFLVRMPVSPTMRQIENTEYPWIDQKIDSLAIQFDVEYFNLFKLQKEFKYNDGSHLSPESAKEVSSILADSILYSMNRKENIDYN